MYLYIYDEKEFILMSEKSFKQHDVENKKLGKGYENENENENENEQF